MQPPELLRDLTRWIRKTAIDGVTGQDVYIALRSCELSVADVIERRFGSKELAELQAIAYEVHNRLQVQEIRRGDPIPQDWI